MVDAAHDAGVHSLLPVLVVLVAELPGGGKSKLKKYLIGRIERIENKVHSSKYFISFFHMVLKCPYNYFFLLLCLVFLGDQVLCGGESLF